MEPAFSKIIEVRHWIYSQIDPDTLRIPSDDDVWAFITTRWRYLTTHDAEKLLGRAMAPLPYAA